MSTSRMGLKSYYLQRDVAKPDFQNQYYMQIAYAY